MLKPVTRQIAIIALAVIALAALWLDQTPITYGVTTGLFALLKGEVRH